MKKSPNFFIFLWLIDYARGYYLISMCLHSSCHCLCHWFPIVLNCDLIICMGQLQFLYIHLSMLMSMFSILETCAAEKDVHSLAVGWYTLWMTINSISSKVWLNSDIYFWSSLSVYLWQWFVKFTITTVLVLSDF